MNGKITIDTAMIEELVETLKSTVTYFDTNFKPGVNEASKVLKELGLFSNGLNIISSQVDKVEENLCNTSIIVMKHKEEAENTLNEIKKYMDSIMINGDNSVSSIHANSYYNTVNLNDIVYSKEIQSTNNGKDVNTDFNTTVNYVEVENINGKTINNDFVELKENDDNLYEIEV